MNRRAFLQRFGIGVGAALALASLPVSAIEGLSTEAAAKRCAIEFLRKRYNAHVSGRSMSQFPLSMHVPSGLFEAFKGEITACQRFCSTDELQSPITEHLMFKGTPMFVDTAMPVAWDVRFTARPAVGREYVMNTTGAILA